MIEGIEILNKTEITHAAVWAVVLIIVSWILILCGIAMTTCRKISISITGLTIIIIAMITFILLVTIQPQQSTGEYEYQVIIDDSVSLTEFYDTYEIIEHNGKIWTIREKE